MSTIIKNDDGEDIEVFTAEEIEAQKQEAIDQYKADNPDKTGELSALQTKLREAEEKLAKNEDKSINFATLRAGKEKAEKDLKDFMGSIDEKINTVKREVMEGVNKDHYNETIKTFAGDDAELSKKIEYHYKRLADSASTKEEITNKIKDAYVLATKKDDDGVSSTIFSSGGVGRLNIKSNSQKLSPEAEALGGKMGLSSDDFKKYSK